MGSGPASVFVFFGEAVSDSTVTGYPVGERHRVAAFGRGHEIDFAAELAAEHLLDAGWTDVEFEEGEAFAAERLVDADEAVITTWKACERDGSAGIVFSEVVEDGPEA